MKFFSECSDIALTQSITDDFINRKIIDDVFVHWPG